MVTRPPALRPEVPVPVPRKAVAADPVGEERAKSTTYSSQESAPPLDEEEDDDGVARRIQLPLRIGEQWDGYLAFSTLALPASTSAEMRLSSSLAHSVIRGSRLDAARPDKQGMLDGLRHSPAARVGRRSDRRMPSRLRSAGFTAMPLDVDEEAGAKARMDMPMTSLAYFTPSSLKPAFRSLTSRISPSSSFWAVNTDAVILLGGGGGGGRG
mmetsp:Transcript_37273/g.111628  ORF Transcript_37273/g.111628 Transcript_37273/m.111628 type:complete len:212 (+) Transcript_37273:6306-6941(+)